jgi:hypothetical protein
MRHHQEYLGSYSKVRHAECSGPSSPTKNYLIEVNSLEETTILFHQQSSYKHLQRQSSIISISKIPTNHKSITMSDTGRKDFSTSMLLPRSPSLLPVTNNTTEAKEELTPDSSKSTQQKLSENVTDTADRVVRGGQPDDSKSNVQSTFDKTQRTSDNEAHGGATNSM